MMKFSPGMSSAVTMVKRDQSMAGSKRMDLMRPRGMVERTVAPYHMPGRVMSSTYWARPVTLARPSLRGGEVPRSGEEPKVGGRSGMRVRCVGYRRRIDRTGADGNRCRGRFVQAGRDVIR